MSTLPFTRTVSTEDAFAEYTRSETRLFFGHHALPSVQKSVISALFPSERTPRFLIESALAPYSVAILSASSAGTDKGSNVSTLCRSAARFVSSSISRLLFDEAPSVPSATQMPSLKSFGTGAMPLASFILLPGLCTARMSYFFITAMSHSSRCTQCAATAAPPSKSPVSATQVKGLFPYALTESLISVFVSCM